MKKFISSEGNLVNYETGKIIRENYRIHHKNIKTGQDLRATLRNWEFTSVGGYPLFLFSYDGCQFHFNCVKENLREELWNIRFEQNNAIVGCEINYENDHLYCDHCGKKIESAYVE